MYVIKPLETYEVNKHGRDKAEEEASNAVAVEMRHGSVVEKGNSAGSFQCCSLRNEGKLYQPIDELNSLTYCGASMTTKSSHFHASSAATFWISNGNSQSQCVAYSPLKRSKASGIPWSWAN
jgi:hypothetical protein